MLFSKKTILISLFIILKASIIFSQIVDASPETQTICSGGSATLTAVVTPGGPGSLPTTSYAISSAPYAPDPYNSGTAVTLTDDSQTGLLPIGFTFCFYGNSYTQFIIGSNNWIGFQAGETSTWVTAAIPNPSAFIAPRNTIMGAWQDINPSLGGTVRFALYGVAPNRRLSVSWRNVPTFSCGALYTSQITIYETTNIIETHFQNKPICATWNGGKAVHGLHNSTGTLATVVPGRNNTSWTTTNETTRFTPNGIATYTINWYVLPSNTLVGTGSPITVTPPAGQPSTSYYAQITGTSGCGTALSSRDTVVVLQTTPTPPIVSNTTICNGFSATLTASGSGPVYEWYNAPGGTLLGTGATFTTPALTSTTSYYVQTNAAGCIGSQAPVTVTVASIITVNAGLDDSICSGENYSLGVTPIGLGYTYSWDAPGLPGFSNSATPIVNPAVTTTYTVTVTDTLGCTGTDVVTIIVGTPIIITASGSPTNCSGSCDGAGSVSATGSFGGYSYIWSNGAISSTVSSLCTSTYTVIVTDLLGCTAQDTIQVLEPTPIALTVTTTNSNCNLPDGSATVVASGGVGGYSYLWTDGQTTATATNLIPGTYCVIVTDLNGCFDSICVTVISPPGVTATISNTPVTCNGFCDGTASITTSLGVAPYTYLWNNGQTNLTATGLCSGSYTCTVTDANGCFFNASTTITQPTIIIIDVIPPSTICIGQSVTLNASANGGHPLGGYTFDWTSPAFNGPSYSVSPTTTTTYTVIATDTLGCTGTDVVTIIVGTPIIITASGSPTNCSGSCDGAGSVSATGSFGGYSYIWSNGAISSTVSSLCTSTYTVIVTDLLGCTAQDTIQVLEPTPIALTVTTTNSNCNLPDGSATVVASGGVGGYSYLWTDGQTTATATNLIPGTYCVIVTDLNGCFDSICVTVISPPGVTATISNTPVTCNGFCDGTASITTSLGVAPYTYLWNNGQTNLTATGLCSGSYTCTVTDANGCFFNASTTITQPTIIIIDVIPPSTICIGQSVTLNASANGGHPLGGYTFDWTSPAFNGPSYSVSPTTTTTYTVIATDSAGCVSLTPQTVTITVNAPLAVIASPNVSICPGGNTTLTSIASGGDGSYTFNWMPGAGSASSFNVSPASTTSYTITVTDGCTTLPASAIITVTILPLPVIAFSPNVISGCFPTCITFTNSTTVAGGAIASWNWDLGDGTTSVLQNPTTHCSYTAGTYDITLTAITTGGCSSTSTINNMITIFPQPVAQFTFGPQPTTTETPTINFTDLSIDATNWVWDFGDATNLFQPNSSNQMNPFHIYGDTGQYCVTLIVQSIGGCPDTTINCLRIEPEYTFYIPNAFTPNGDEMNNIFAPKGQNIVDFTMRIFDRWGNMIFNSNSINDGWNGKFQNMGLVVQEDVYVYNIEIKDNLGNIHQYIGHVTIVK